jgi:hypothetical protein
MDLTRYTDEELLRSLEAECAKSLGELRCAQGDLDKANSRLRFILAVIHEIKDKKEKV